LWLLLLLLLRFSPLLLLLCRSRFVFWSLSLPFCHACCFQLWCCCYLSTHSYRTLLPVCPRNVTGSFVCLLTHTLAYPFFFVLFCFFVVVVVVVDLFRPATPWP
jgi:hypothetical protein